MEHRIWEILKLKPGRQSNKYAIPIIATLCNSWLINNAYTVKDAKYWFSSITDHYFLYNTHTNMNTHDAYNIFYHLYCIGPLPPSNHGSGSFVAPRDSHCLTCCQGWHFFAWEQWFVGWHQTSQQQYQREVPTIKDEEDVAKIFYNPSFFSSSGHHHDQPSTLPSLYLMLTSLDSMQFLYNLCLRCLTMLI